MGGILLIDDAQFARMVLRTILEDNGYEICGEAENGREGIEKFKQLKPDLVLCDVRMNEMDGDDCLRAILAEDPSAKVVFCTAISEPAHLEALLKAGAKGCIEKPVRGKELLDVTKRLLGDTAGGKSYKELMEQYAEEAGLAKKPLLDFFEAFRSINGFDLDDERINEQYLKENGESLFVGTRALLSAKLTMEQLRLLEEAFHRLGS
ncbi:MAG: response regulator [Butyrivibrio sp.]|nr:response regulator [Muribaculum sp.]MCM1551865.1 response regulator [Butyrivibrio sp.]